MSSSKIESALLKASNIKPQRKGEDRQKYLVRLMLGISKLPDDDWDELESVEGAQEWYNAASDADNASKPLDDFPDLEVEDEEEEEEEEEAVSASTRKRAKKAAKKPAKRVAKKAAKKPAKKAAKKPAAKPAAKRKAAAPKKTSARRELKLMVVRKPTITTDEIIAALEKKGHTPPSRITVTTTRSETRDTMRVILEAKVDLKKAKF